MLNFYCQINTLSANDIVNKNERFENKFGIDYISIENHQKPYIYWMPKMHKSHITARLQSEL